MNVILDSKSFSLYVPLWLPQPRLLPGEQLSEES